jgi:long-chain acyl-CoA synthetase
VGRPIEAADVRVEEDGEIVVRGPMVFHGYYNKPDETKEVFTKDGYFRTGDIGKLDEDGFLFITDRKKELIVMSNGKNVAPQPIENALKTQPGIGMAALIGNDRKFISALISPDMEALEAKAKEMGLDGADPKKLLEAAEVQKLVQDAVDTVNEGLSRYEQIKTFRVVPEEFSQEGGELTPTLKVKRRIVEEKYKGLIESMYPKD